MKDEVEEVCGTKIIHDIAAAEPIGPKNLLDIIVVSPCTGNTIAKTALGVTDTPVTMAVKAHLRNNKPVVLAIATNDALGASAKNIGCSITQIIFILFLTVRMTRSVKIIRWFAISRLFPKRLKKRFRAEQLQPVIL